MRSSIRTDLTHGTAYGLATSAAVCTAMLAPDPGISTSILWIAIGAAVAASCTLLGRRGFLQPSYIVAFAALLFATPLASTLGAGSAALIRRLVRVRRLDGHAPQLSFAISREVLAATAAVGAWTMAGSLTSGGGWLALFLPVVLHVAAYAAARAVIGELGRWRLRGRLHLRPTIKATVVALPGFAAAAACGGIAYSLWGHEPGRALALTGAALLFVAAVRGNHLRRGEQLTRGELALRQLRQASTRALARIMEERDPATRDHSRRVHRLCLGVGRSLEMSESEMETLSAAALLHDIGKLGIPESVLTKPGSLTPEETTLLQRHPVVGAEIVQALPYSESLASLVRFHHERWDGRGYPDGLRGREIPLGARILSVVDAYDALTTDRPYRRAVPHRDAAAHLVENSGSEFDPDVVDALLDYLEMREPGQLVDQPPLIERKEPVAAETPVCGSLALAQRELEVMYDIARATDYGLKQAEFLTLAGCRLASLIPHKSMVVYRLDVAGKRLQAGFAMGTAADKLRLASVKIGSCISGWAAQHRRAIVGRNHISPIDRDGTRSDLEDWMDDAEVALLRSSLAAPLIAAGEVIGVITLYDAQDRGFSDEEKGALTRVAANIAQVAVNDPEQAPVARASLTDPHSGVPNARFLWLEAAHRIAQPDPGFGLLALRVRQLTSFGERSGADALNRMISQIAKRFAAGCSEGETLVRFGHDLFMVLTPHDDAGSIAARADRLAEFVRRDAITLSTGERLELDVDAAHVLFGEDGNNLDALIDRLDRRLAERSNSRRTVIPFPSDRAAQGVSR